MTQTKIFEVLDQVGFPEGVVNMVHGSKDVVNGILDHPDIAGVSFVGSSPTAKYIYERCGATGKRVQALGGAKNIVAVMPDAKLGPGHAVFDHLLYGCTGQRCLSGSILAPVGDVADELLAKFMAAAKAVKLGEGLDEKTDMGPVVSAAHKQRVLGYIEKGIAEGAKLVLDGRDCKVKDYPNGFFVGPTIFDNVTPEMTIAREEIFGPVVSIVRCKNLNEAVELINTRGLCQRRLPVHEQRRDGARVQVQGQAEHDRDQHRHCRAHVLFPVRRRRPVHVRGRQGPRPGDLPVLYGHQGRH